MRSDIAEIREQVAQLRAALLSPGVDALEGCIPVLENAAERLRSLNPQSVDPGERAAFLQEVSLLKRDLLRVQSMTADGSAFWQGWARMVGGAAWVSTGYTPFGHDSTVEERVRLEVQG
jgi:hypothetical protein